MEMGTPMRKTIKLYSAFAVGLLCAFAGAGGLADWYYSGVRSAHGGVAESGAKTVAAAALPDFARLAKKLGPAVVNISTTQVRRTAEQAPAPGSTAGESGASTAARLNIVQPLYARGKVADGDATRGGGRYQLSTTNYQLPHGVQVVR